MYDKNLYYSPEAFGLTPVAEIDWSSGSYEFDLRVVWRDSNGNFYTARDSGCSCPSPFEDFSGLPELDRLDLVALEAEARQGGSTYRNERTPGEVMDFLAKVRSAVGEASQ